MLDSLRSHVDISHLSNFKVPATTQYFYELGSESNIDQFGQISTWAERENIPLLIVSGGTNLLFAFDVFHGIVVHNKLSGWNYDPETKQLFSYGSESIWDIASELESGYNNHLWHRFIGLPGSVAGAIYGNAGCFGLETENNFVSCRVLDRQSGEVRHFTKEEMQFGYRSSRLKHEKKYFLISACFDLSQVVEKYSSEVDNVYFREHVQPKGNSCGSFFKNPAISRDDFVKKFPDLREVSPKNISAGFLLEQVGLKGFKCGGAFFSEMHANFLMNDGSGTWRDLISLIELAQKRVNDRFGIMLENEVQIIH